MAIVINGSGTVTGLAVGGLPDGTVDNDTVASGLASSKLTGALPAISAASLTNVPKDVTVGGRKNMIINGAMQIDQRTTSKTGVTSSGYHTLDRWKLDNSGLGTFTMSRSGDAPSGFYSSLKMDCTTAYGSAGGDDFNAIHQDLEAYDGVSLGYGTSDAKSLTVSFWVKCSQTGTLQFNLLHYASSTRQISATYTINAANTWEKKTITFAGDTSQASDNDNSKGLVFEWFLASGTGRTSGGSPQTSWGAYALTKRNAGSTISIGDSTSDTWQITGVQAEIGSTATDFEYRSYGEELSLCQRYYQQFGHPTVEQPVGAGVWNDATQVLGHFPYIQEMRAIPTTSVSSTGFLRAYGGFSGNKISTGGQPIDGITTTSARLNVDFASSTAGDGTFLQVVGGQYIYLDAELQMIITNAKYHKTVDTNDIVKATIDGKEMSVPMDTGNRHYAEILKQVADGTITIAEAD